MKHLSKYIAIVILLNGCVSNELSKSDVKNTVNSCLEKKRMYGAVNVTIGKLRFYLNNQKSKALFEIYKELVDNGLIQMDLIASSKGIKYNSYTVKFTEKGKSHILHDRNKKMLKINQTIYSVKAYDYYLDDVKEINTSSLHEGKEAIVIYKKNNLTPFNILDSNTLNYWLKKEQFTKEGKWFSCQ